VPCHYLFPKIISDIRVYNFFLRKSVFNILTLGVLGEGYSKTCHAKEIEHFRLLGSYFGNVIKQKKNLS
jgi:hypothetical protein